MELVTSYKDQDVVYNCTHIVNAGGLVFGCGSNWVSDTECELRYKPYDLSEKESVFTRSLIDGFAVRNDHYGCAGNSVWYCSLIREFDDEGRPHYYPLPKLQQDFLAGTITPARKLILTQIKKELGIS